MDSTLPSVSGDSYDDLTDETTPKSMIAQSGTREHVRSLGSATDITYYGVTLTVWTHADRGRATTLKTLKSRNAGNRPGVESLKTTPVMPLREKARSTSVPWTMPDAESEAGMASYIVDDSLLDVERERSMLRPMLPVRSSDVDLFVEDTRPVFQDDGDIFWLPVGLTILSRHPIYDVMQDYLRLSVCASLFLMTC